MTIESNTNKQTSLLTIRPTYKPFGIAGFITLIFSGFIFGFILAVVEIVRGNYNLPFTIFLGLFFSVAYYNFFNIYWTILGDEIVEIHRDFIRHTKCVWILSHSKKYNKTKIRDIKIIDTSNSFGATGASMFGFSNIHIQFNYGRKKKIIGKQITQGEAELIIDEFKDKMYAINDV